MQTEARYRDTQAAWEHAWKYFNVHATQRMSVFNFYLILVGLLTAGMVKTFERDFPFPWLGCVLGATLVIMSFIFWRFDERTRFLIRCGEDALKILEGPLRETESDAKLQIFSREAALTPTFRHWYWPTTYTECLRLTFALFALLGLLGAVVAAGNELDREALLSPHDASRGHGAVMADAASRHATAAPGR